MHDTDLPEKQRHWAVFAILMGTFLSNLDAAIANIALPIITNELSTSASSSIWVVNAYQLVLAITILPLALIGESIGYKKVFLSGIFIFIIGSISCFESTSIEQLIFSRILQGLGGGGLATMGPALIRFVFPSNLTSRGIALLGLTVAISSSSGPSVASFILEISNWRWFFGINVPLGIIIIFAGYFNIPKNTTQIRPFDLIGLIYSSIAISLFIIGIGNIGFVNNSINYTSFIEIAIGFISLFLLLRHEKRIEFPIIPIDLFHIRNFSLSVTTSSFAYCAQTLAYVSLPFILGNQYHKSSAIIGILMTPWPLIIVFIAPIAGRLNEKVNPSLLCSFGMITLSASLLSIYSLPYDSSNFLIGFCLTLCGIGFGFFQTPNNFLLLTSGPRDRGGAASGMMSMSRLIGTTLGAALAILFINLFPDNGFLTSILFASFIAAAGFLNSLRRFKSNRN
jgi:DHA2 family multidrug resistance protein-like MFS transporter